MIDPANGSPADALIGAILKRQPKLEADLLALARGF